jgi:hypothetical protein
MVLREHERSFVAQSAPQDDTMGNAHTRDESGAASDGLLSA